MNIGQAKLNQRILEKGQQYWDLFQGQKPGIFNRSFWQEQMLDWVMKDPEFRIDMFRFIDVLPMLKTSNQVSEHIKSYLLKDHRDLPLLLKAALKAASESFAKGIAARAIKKNVEEMATCFIVGKQVDQALINLHQLYQQGFAFTADLLGEATLTTKEARNYENLYLDLIDKVAPLEKDWGIEKILCTNHLGRTPLGNVSIKLSALDAHLNPLDPKGSVRRLEEKVLPLILKSKDKNVFVNIDMEQYKYHEITYLLFEKISLHRELKDWTNLGIVLQAYHKDSESRLCQLVELAKKRGSPITIRLVKGAYWDYELISSKMEGRPCPVFTKKQDTDIQYEKLTHLLYQNIEHVLPAFGSHNLRSILHAIVLAEQMDLPKEALEFQMLYGMAEPERKALIQEDFRVRIYTPIGELLPGMAYLVRRLLENTSNTGFLRQGFHEGMNVERLLSAPTNIVEMKSSSKAEATTASFQSTPFLDFTKEEVRLKFDRSIKEIVSACPFQVPIAINGKEIHQSEQFKRISPNDGVSVVGEINFATLELCEDAIHAVSENRRVCSNTSLESRIDMVIKLADLLEKDRYELAALQCVEIGKNWKEADADVSEAIDFCRYYADRAKEELKPFHMGNYPSESNLISYIGKGTCAVIAPWNFPLAILTGMSIAPLLSGNPIIMKPAEQSSVTAYFLYKRMLKVGFPKEMIQFLPGRGEIVGAHLVDHIDVPQIVFTGSRDVGLKILKRAGEKKDGQKYMKQVICEMGGKNVIIVDEDADLDEALLGVLHSAFGFAGQKCSACSRLILLSSVAEKFISRLLEAISEIIMDSALSSSSELGPVVDEQSRQKLMETIHARHEGAKCLYRGETDLSGNYVAPAVFKVESIDHPLMQEEFFGPILTILEVASIEEAVEKANATEFALTAGLYSREPARQDFVRQNIDVGNFYLNRSCTGAMVGRQPFGGFGMSGTGNKAGGPGYLKHFAYEKVCTENTMRRGFSPDIQL